VPNDPNTEENPQTVQPAPTEDKKFTLAEVWQLSKDILVHMFTAQSPFRRRLGKIVKNAVAEGLNLLFFIFLLAGARWLVEHLFGGDRFFDRVPVRYCLILEISP
jgi:hypothetical protein